MYGETYMSARGLTLNGQHTVNRACPRRRWVVSEKCAKTFEFLMFLQGGPLPPAHGFPDPRTVIENTSKTIVKQAKSVILRARTVMVPWPRVGDTPGEVVNSDVKPFKIIVKTKDSPFALVSFLYVPLPPAHSSPDPLTVIENPLKSL